MNGKKKDRVSPVFNVSAKTLVALRSKAIRNQPFGRYIIE